MSDETGKVIPKATVIRDFAFWRTKVASSAERQRTLLMIRKLMDKALDGLERRIQSGEAE